MVERLKDLDFSGNAVVEKFVFNVIIAATIAQEEPLMIVSIAINLLTITEEFKFQQLDVHVYMDIMTTEPIYFASLANLLVLLALQVLQQAVIYVIQPN